MISRKKILFLSLLIVHIQLLFVNNAAGQIPKFNSNSSAHSTVYLDFDGHYVQGTSWNWDSSIHARPCEVDQNDITEIFNRVTEDYRIFDINITTDSLVFAQAPIDRRIRIIITPTNKWYGIAGGVALVGSFTWGDGTPAWVFSNILENNPKYIAEAISHETGHTLGLQHQSEFDDQCALISEYSEGKGNGEIGWAPIMGDGYYKNLTTWHFGTSIEGCNVFQNDIEVISTGDCRLGVRNDDHGNAQQTATPIYLYGSHIQSKGMINNAADKDMFTFNLRSASNLRIQATPFHVSSNNSGANLDIKLSLLKSNGDTIGRYNPISLLSSSLDTNLNAGIYFLVAEGVENSNLPDYGSIGYYTLDGTLDEALPITQLTLKGETADNAHILKWSFLADEPVKNATVEVSADGTDFNPLFVVQPSVTTITNKPLGNNGPMYYRVKMTTANGERDYYSNIVSLQYRNAAISLLSNIISGTIRIKAPSAYTYQLMDETGRLLEQGTLAEGFNQIPVRTFTKGMLLLKVFNKNEQRLFKILKQ